MSLHSWLQNLRSTLTPDRAQRDDRRRGSVRAATHRPNLEALEDRSVPAFLAPVDYTPTGWYPAYMAVGDFNEDGTLDLATAGGESAASLTILLGRGDGTFEYAPIPSPFSATSSLVVGDLNGDGTLDLVTTSVDYGYYSSEPDITYVVVMLGHGDGTFASDWYGPYMGAVYAEELADFDGDGNADVFAGVYNRLTTPEWSALLFRGTGAGTLYEPEPREGGFFTPGDADAVDADFNADGNLDYAYLDEAALTAHLGNGDGNFGPPFTTALGFYPVALALGDFNADGRPDVAVAKTGPSQVAVLFNDGVWDGSPPPPPPPPAPSVTIDDRAVTEGNTGTTPATFTVTLSHGTNVDVTVHYDTVQFDATVGSDYTPASGDVIIPAGQTSATVTIAVIGDRLVEPNETFAVNLSAPTNATIADGRGIGTIIDDEPRVSISDVSKREGRNGKTTLFTFTVKLSVAYDQPVTMSFQTVNGTATTGDNDYVGKTGTLTFLPGETSKTITITVKGDRTKEANETFYLDLFDNSSNSLFTKNRGIGTILNDD